MAVLAELRKRLADLRHRGDAAAVEAMQVDSGQLSDRQRASLEERNNINHAGNSPYGPTNNNSGGGYF